MQANTSTDKYQHAAYNKPSHPKPASMTLMTLLKHATFFLLLLLSSFKPVLSDTSKTPETPTSLAPGYSELPFQAPAAGSYELPPLGHAGDGQVLNTDKQSLRLSSLFGDKIVLLSFIYTTCSDVNGCPLATMVLHKLKKRLQKESGLHDKLRLITLSFNPTLDTPEAMREYGKSLADSGVEWQFLTTRSEQDLAPILAAYPQNLQKVYDAKGQFTGTYTHHLRVYLIDTHQQFRNIYNASFLHPDTLINDIKTLLGDNQHSKSSALKPTQSAKLYSAGDNKNNYDSLNYATQSIALNARKGKAIDLYASTQQMRLGLPPIPVPTSNPLSAASIQLGRKLFYDRRLSFNNTFSCAICHIPEQGFTSNELATSVGVEGRSVRRNAPTLYNVAYAEQLFHDGRESTLEQQVWGPLLAHNEMANPSIGHVINKIAKLPDYQQLFETAFKRPLSMETLGMALASYQRSLNAADSPFDRWYFGKDAKAISPAAQKGFQLFSGKARCAHCHSLAEHHALFTDQQLHNTGIGYSQSMNKTPASTKVQIAPGVYTEISPDALQSVSESKSSDLGQYEITQNPEHRWRYKTPTLRNISLTAPYMHNGSLASLKDVVNFYNQGGMANENLDPLIKPLQLTATEIDALVAFLESLTGSNVPELVGDAFAAPIGEAE